MRIDPGAAGAELQRQINEERVSALVRISGTLEALIAALTDAKERLILSPESERATELAAWHALRARALRYRWYLEVQRESLGLRDHSRIDEFYKIPGL